MERLLKQTDGYKLKESRFQLLKSTSAKADRRV